MAISDFLTESGAFVLWTPPTFNHRVSSAVISCSLLPRNERQTYWRVNDRHGPNVRLALLPGELSPGVRYLPTGNKKSFERYARSWAKAWKKFTSRISKHWDSVTSQSWSDVWDRAQQKYQLDPRSKRVDLFEYGEQLCSDFNKCARQGPNFQDLQYTYVVIDPIVMNQVRSKEAQSFDAMAYRWLHEAHRLVGGRFTRYAGKFEKLMKKTESVSGTVFVRRRYHQKPDLTEMNCLACCLDFFNMDKALRTCNHLIECVHHFKETYYHSSPEVFKKAQADAANLFRFLMQKCSEIAEEFSDTFDPDALKPRSKRWRTA